ncbi:MAG: methionine--tRNA ligase [Bdellovibrionota bacterium]
MGKPLYITTPLYYVNAKPHLGHAYTTILGDTLKSYSLQQGRDTFFLAGTDEHGEKIAQSAEKAGKSPQEFVDETSSLFTYAWKLLGLQPDISYRTTLLSHRKLVQEALQRLKDQGDIRFSSYTGKYCLGCERFRTDLEWDANGLCPDHQRPPEIREESNYFFNMEKYRAKTLEYYRQHTDAIVPNHYMKEALAMLSEPLEDLCISRPTTRLTWGIPLPFDDKYVTYVWFDALLSYLGGLGYTGHPIAEEKSFRADLWKESRHLIGKDILKTHAVYWPTMLFALGLEPARQLQVNGFWLTAGLKMSKSLGNVVDPVKVYETFGAEPFRYFLMRDMSYGVDASFTWESFISRANSELANGIGNLASRTLTLVHKNLGAAVPTAAHRTADDRALLEKVNALPAKFSEDFDNARYHIALATFAETVATCDRYINDTKPWSLAKDPAQKERLESVLGTMIDALSVLSVVMRSVLPEGSRKLRVALGFSGDPDILPWSAHSQRLSPGTPLGEVPRLYPRLELPKDPDATV